MPILNKATVTLPSDREILMTRVFDAPRELVFRTYTEPALVARWWGGPRGKPMVVDKMDVRPGGEWRYVLHSTDGDNAFRGAYHEVVSPERLVYTFEWEGLPGHVCLVTTAFEEVDGKTRMLETSLFSNPADRDGMLQSGMEEGANESMHDLDQLLAELQGAQSA